MPDDPIELLLRRTPTTNAIRAQAWDAFHEAADQDELATRLEGLQIPKDIKAQLWDMKHSSVPQPESVEDQGPTRTWADTAVDWLPTIGGTIGGLAGASAGPIGAIGGAALGGAGGEAWKQLMNRALGNSAPTTATEAAQSIGMAGGLQAGAQALGGAVASVAKPVAGRLMQSAVKPTQAVLKQYRTTAPKIIQTLLDEGITVTKAGAEKLEGLVTATNDQIKDLIAGSTAQVSPLKVAGRLTDVTKRAMQQVNPQGDLEAISQVGEQFLSHPSVSSHMMPVQQAQAMKIGTYQALKGKYGELKGAAIEAEKALARGLKEEIAQAVPGVASLNAKESAQLAALDAVGRRVALSGSANPIGFSWVTRNPLTFIASMMDKSSAAKSLMAQGLYHSAATAAKVSPTLVRLAIQAIGTSPDEEP